jgi:hypothetical protein
MKRFNTTTIKVVLWLTVVTSAIHLLSGCAVRTVNTANPKVVFANTLLAASNVVDEVASANAAANEMLTKLQSTEPDYYTKVKPILVNIAKTNDKAIATIRAAEAGDTSIDWRAAVVAVVDAAGKEDLTKFGFKNKDSQSLVKIGIASLELALTAITNSFGGGK